jgi:lipopolysaccharide/colanic/teichoic acid biosynthesis glycosyltransferase
MVLAEWENLPSFMCTKEVRACYDFLACKKRTLILKRVFDFLFSAILIFVLFPLMLTIAATIKFDSKGPVFFRQERITAFGKKFRIFKFRTMFVHENGAPLTLGNDVRITRIGRFLRKYRLDEIPQLFNILKGEMSFVGARPEIPEYVTHYTPEIITTLLMPAGITGYASINFKDENKLLGKGKDYEKIYIEKILPEKAKYNLDYIKKFSFWGDIKIIVRTFLSMIQQ